jgi:hypothetical protein
MLYLHIIINSVIAFSKNTAGCFTVSHNSQGRQERGNSLLSPRPPNTLPTVEKIPWIILLLYPQQFHINTPKERRLSINLQIICLIHVTPTTRRDIPKRIHLRVHRLRNTLHPVTYEDNFL